MTNELGHVMCIINMLRLYMSPDGVQKKKPTEKILPPLLESWNS